MILTLLLFLSIYINNLNELIPDYKTLGSMVLGERRGTLLDSYYDEEYFTSGRLDETEALLYTDEKIKGLIVPHDIRMSFMLSDAFEKVEGENYETVILIGPNHFEKGNDKFVSCNCDWETPFGLLEGDSRNTRSLIDSTAVEENSDVILEEHSIGTITPYIKYYLPDSNVIPVVISKRASYNDVELLFNEISNLVGGETLIVAAVDFSHYLNSIDARKNDRITWQLIKDKDYEHLMSLNSVYTDSPASLVLYMKLVDYLESGGSYQLMNINSGELKKDIGAQTTSYFTVVSQ